MGKSFRDLTDDIKQELSAAENAWEIGNEGKARVCARRAVARADELRLARKLCHPFCGDAMAHLRRIQQDDFLPPAAREAAERLTTPVRQKHCSTFSTDPIGDARIIIASLAEN